MSFEQKRLRFGLKLPLGLAVALLFIALDGWEGSSAQGADAGMSTNAGLFTEEQAQFGEDRYRAMCGRCHGRNPQMPVGSNPRLTGYAFETHWSGRSVGELFDRIRLTMPAMTPLLEPELAAGLTAYVLASNGYPAGPDPLPTDRDRLRQFLIEPSNQAFRAP